MCARLCHHIIPGCGLLVEQTKKTLAIQYVISMSLQPQEAATLPYILSLPYYISATMRRNSASALQKQSLAAPRAILQSIPRYSDRSFSSTARKAELGTADLYEVNSVEVGF